MVLFRQLASPTLARTMPDALVLLFGVSQLAAIVDFRVLARELTARPWTQQALVFLALVALGLPGVVRTLVAQRDDPGVAWVWRLPVRTRPVFAVLAAIRGAPVASLTLLLGVLPFGLALGLYAALGAVVGHRRFRRSIRARPRGRWWARHPLTARINRDLLALQRNGGLQLLPPLLGTTLMHAAIVRQWDANGIASGGLVGILLLGWLPTWTAVRLATVLGPAWLPRHSPLPSSSGTLALWVVTGAPLVALVVLQTLLHPAGLLRRLALAVFFTAFGAWTVVRRAPAQRRHAAGDGLAIAVFAGLFAWAWPPAALVLLAASVALFLLTTRTLR